MKTYKNLDRMLRDYINANDILDPLAKHNLRKTY